MTAIRNLRRKEKGSFTIYTEQNWKKEYFASNHQSINQYKLLEECFREKKCIFEALNDTQFVLTQSKITCRSWNKVLAINLLSRSTWILENYLGLACLLNTIVEGSSICLTVNKIQEYLHGQNANWP